MKYYLILFFLIFTSCSNTSPPKKEIVETGYTIVEIPEILSPDISVKIPSFLKYPQLVKQLEQWHQEAPEITKMGVYGKSTRGQNLVYFRIKGSSEKLPRVLITACIHGNEPHSTTVVMGLMGTMLSQYGKNKYITNLIDTRDLYFIPVVSPDSFPHSREVNGVDPNRDFPTLNNPNKKSVQPIEYLKKFFIKNKFKACVSSHTFGRVFGIPFGDSRKPCLNINDYKKIVGKMSELSNYKLIHLNTMYSHLIYGTEADWYYRNGAFSLVMEIGTHQRIPTKKETQSELRRTYSAFLYFIKKAPLVKINFF